MNFSFWVVLFLFNVICIQFVPLVHLGALKVESCRYNHHHYETENEQENLVQDCHGVPLSLFVRVYPDEAHLSLDSVVDELVWLLFVLRHLV